MLTLQMSSAEYGQICVASMHHICNSVVPSTVAWLDPGGPINPIQLLMLIQGVALVSVLNLRIATRGKIMKRILLTTTALTMTAGIAAAEVSVTGDFRLGFNDTVLLEHTA